MRAVCKVVLGLRCSSGGRHPPAIPRRNERVAMRRNLLVWPWRAHTPALAGSYGSYTPNEAAAPGTSQSDPKYPYLLYPRRAGA